MTLERNKRKLDAIRRQVANDNHPPRVRPGSRVLLLDRPASATRSGWWARLLAKLAGWLRPSGAAT